MTTEPERTSHQGHSGSGAHQVHEHPAGQDTSHSAAHGNASPGGVLVSEHGYTLELDRPILGDGTQTVTFKIIGPDGRPVTEYGDTHEKELHLIAVRRDMAHFQHVHPVRDTSGTWSTDLDLDAGVWRIFADFVPVEHGQPMTLGVDAHVGGTYAPQQLPAEERTVHLGAYTVELDGGLVANEATELRFTVSKEGRPVTDLQPYLGAFGHLVALRKGDLAYLHVHPEGSPNDGQTEPGPTVEFFAVAPSGGTYRLHLDFQHEGIVRTAQFTVHTTAAAA